MNRYISDHDLDALAHADGLEAFGDFNGPEDEYEAPAIDPKWIIAAAVGGLLLVAILWYSYSQIGGRGNVPLITASGDPIKIRPTNPGGLEIPFQDMALYDRIQPGQEPVLPTLTPPSELPQMTLEPEPIPVETEPDVVVDLVEPDATQSTDDQTAAITVEALEPVAEQLAVPETPEPVATIPPRTVASGEGESLFARPAAPIQQPSQQAAPRQSAPAQPVQTASVDDVSHSVWPPIPQRHPERDLLTPVQQSAQQSGGTYIQAPNAAGEQRLIHRGTIASSEVPLTAAQGGLRPGGALGLTDESGTLVYRNSLRQNADPVMPSGPVEGDVELVLQRPAGTTPNEPARTPITTTPVQANRSADGTIEIRSPNRLPPVTISSDQPQQPPVEQAPAQSPATQQDAPRLIPLPPERPVGPASGGQVASVPEQQPVPQTAHSLNEINNLPASARAPAPVSTGIVRGSVVNQRAPVAVPAVPAQQAAPQQQPQQQATSVSSVPPSVQPAPPPAGDGWRIQLASVGSQEAAIREWRRFQNANQDLLGNLDLKVQRADLGARGIYYRVQAGVLSRDDASAVCGQLKSRGTDCLITRD